MYISKFTGNGKFPQIGTLNRQRGKANNKYIDRRFTRDYFALLQKICKVPRVAGILNTRRTAVTAYNWNLITDLPEVDMSDHMARLRKPIEQIIRHHTDRLFGGVLFGLEWNDIAANKYPTPKLKHYELTDFEKIDTATFYTYADDNTKTKHDVENDADTWVYYSDGNNEQGGVIDSIADQIIYLHEIVEKWDSLNNRLQGVIIGEIDGEKLYRSGAQIGMDADGFQKLSDDLQSALENIGSDSVNVLKTLSGIDVKLSSLVEAQTATAYNLYKNALETDIAVAILGQANTTELPANGGSRAALQVLNSIRQDILFNDVNTITEIVNNFLAVDWKKSTNSYDLPYRFEFDIDDFEDYEENAQILNYIASAGLSIPVKKAELYQKIGYKVPAPDDEIIDIQQAN